MSEPPVMPPLDIDPIPGEVLEPDSPPIPGWEDAPVSGDRVNVFDAPIVAGDPLGARIEIRSTGFHAFNGTGTETAHIDGAEGVFVGGEFRTSDALPGQVTLADNAYIDGAGGNAHPGIRVDPIDASSTAIPPGIGPVDTGMIIDGGRDASGAHAYTIMAPGAIQSRWIKGAKESSSYMDESSAALTAMDGTNAGVVQAAPTFARLWVNDAAGTVSQIRADPTEAYLYSKAGGTPRYLSVDANGLWVKTFKSGSWKSYNLEETAQDSGWVAFTPASGITANNASWRNKGGVMWFRGFVTASWVSGWNLVRAGFTSGEIPTFGVERPAWNTAGINYGVRMRATGDLEVYAPTAGAATIRLDGLNYPTS